MTDDATGGLACTSVRSHTYDKKSVQQRTEPHEGDVDELVDGQRRRPWLALMAAPPHALSRNCPQRVGDAMTLKCSCDSHHNCTATRRRKATREEREMMALHTLLQDVCKDFARVVFLRPSR